MYNLDAVYVLISLLIQEHNKLVKCMYGMQKHHFKWLCLAAGALDMTPCHKMLIQNLVYCMQKYIMYTFSVSCMYSLINFTTEVNKPCLVYQGERNIPIVVLWQHLEAKTRIRPTVTRHTECLHLRTVHRIHICIFSSSIAQ